MIESLRMSRELVDQVIFGMENQDAVYVLDARESAVVSIDEADADSTDRYIELPSWRSVDGYNLMEQFVATLHNPIFRERLRAILASGRGVFRQFKDTVRERREIERSWYLFKERHMRSLVVDWFNTLRESEGLARLESEFNETETTELIDIDFEFRLADADDLETIVELDRAAFDEVFADRDPAVVQLHRDRRRAGVPAPDAPQSVVIVGQTSGEEFAAFLWAVVNERDGARVAFVEQFYVLPDFRGLGLGRGLFYHAVGELRKQRVGEVVLEFLGPGTELAPSFQKYGMTTLSVRLSLDVDRWYRSELL